MSEKSSDERSRGTQSSAVYRDFAVATTASILKIVDPPTAKRKGPRGGVQTPFPNRLFDMLDTCHNEGLESIVSWQPHGRSFIVHKPTQFETKILPRFFSQSKMSSFQRQLNLYGFLRQNSGPDRGSYYHELFLRGRPDLPKIMVRTRVKGIGMGRTNKAEKEPDFYGMTPSILKDRATATAVDESVLETETEEEQQQVSPATAHERETDAMHKLPFECPRAPRNNTRSSMPPIEWIHPVSYVHDRPLMHPPFAPIVTPMPDEGGRSLFNPGNQAGFSEMAVNIADSHIPSCGYSQNQQGMMKGRILSILPITAQDLPMIPMSSHSTSYIPLLQPRYRENNVDDEDTGLFEGLEFQVVDDDSLEQFESELISDGTESL
eukprot:scaffold9178_cov176-Amphora_coffeaeformis.AAC.5